MKATVEDWIVRVRRTLDLRLRSSLNWTRVWLRALDRVIIELGALRASLVLGRDHGCCCCC